MDEGIVELIKLENDGEWDNFDKERFNDCEVISIGATQLQFGDQP